MPSPNTNALTWFEIPTEDIDRARRFYEEVFRTTLVRYDVTDPIFMFPHHESGVTGALVERPQHSPAMCGTTVYLRLEGSVDDAIDRLTHAGGRVVVPKMTVPGVPGEMFCMRDTEGNLVGVHSPGHVS